MTFAGLRSLKEAHFDGGAEQLVTRLHEGPQRRRLQGPAVHVPSRLGAALLRPLRPKPENKARQEHAQGLVNARQGDLRQAIEMALRRDFQFRGSKIRLVLRGEDVTRPAGGAKRRKINVITRPRRLRAIKKR